MGGTRVADRKAQTALVDGGMMSMVLQVGDLGRGVRRRAWRGLATVLWATGSLVLGAVHAHAQPSCIGYANYLHWESGVDLPDRDAHDVVIVGSHAFVANQGAGLIVVDVSDADNPVVVGSIDTPGLATGVAFAGSHVFVADGDAGLQVIDITAPTAPAIVGAVDTPGSAGDVAVAGSYAMVADGASGLQVVDVADPAAPSITGTVDTPGNALGVTLAGSYAYVADGAPGLQVINIADPAVPVVVGSIDPPGSAQDVTTQGDYAFVASQNQGIRVVDVADPAAPALVGGLSFEGARGVTVAGNRAFVAAHTGLQVVNIEDPLAPSLVAGVSTSATARGVAVSGGYAYIAGDISYNLSVVDLTHIAPAPLISATSIPSGGGGVRAIATGGQYTYVIKGQVLLVVDTSDPEAPLFMGNVGINQAQEVAIGGDGIVYVAAGASGMVAADVSDPTAPLIVGTLDTSDDALDVAAQDDLVVIADEHHGIDVIDVADPTQPLLLGSVDTPGASYGVALRGGRAFVADAGGGLQVVDLSDPSAPVIVGSVLTPEDARRVALSGDYALVSCRSAGVVVVDISNPSAPAIVASAVKPFDAFEVVAHGAYAYVADGFGGMVVVDISDPTAPETVGSVEGPTTDDVAAVAADGRAVYFATDVFNAAYLECDAPFCDAGGPYAATLGAPVEFDGTASSDPDGTITSFAWDFGDGNAGAGATPSHTYAAAGTYTVTLCVTDDHHVVSCCETVAEVMTSTGVERASVSLPDATVVYPNRPNPFNPTTHITFELAEASHVALRVVDVNGRMVRVLVDEHLPPESYTIEWDGRDASGRRLGSGVYVYELRAGGTVARGKMSLVQ